MAIALAARIDAILADADSKAAGEALAIMYEALKKLSKHSGAIGGMAESMLGLHRRIAADALAAVDARRGTK